MIIDLFQTLSTLIMPPFSTEYLTCRGRNCYNFFISASRDKDSPFFGRGWEYDAMSINTRAITV